MQAFRCAMCERVIAPDPGKPHLTGYGEHDGDKICYPCCAVMDRNEMDDMVRNVDAGRRERSFGLYLVGPREQGWTGLRVTNWPGTLEYRVRSTRRSEIWGACRAERVDFWFTDHAGREWHGVVRGDMDLARCLPLKRKAARVRR